MFREPSGRCITHCSAPFQLCVLADPAHASARQREHGVDKGRLEGCLVCSRLHESRKCKGAAVHLNVLRARLRAAEALKLAHNSHVDVRADAFGISQWIVRNCRDALQTPAWQTLCQGSVRRPAVGIGTWRRMPVDPAKRLGPTADRSPCVKAYKIEGRSRSTAPCSEMRPISSGIERRR